jgi:hypothetical protein
LTREIDVEEIGFAGEIDPALAERCIQHDQRRQD